MMALSLSKFFIALLFACVSNAGNTVTYNWSIDWVNRNPDALFERPVIGINGQWPIPSLNITKGDRVVANVYNNLGNQSTSVHFHGLYQNGSSSMDGPVGVTQCDIPPGRTMTYNFTIDQPGTYWYHSHTRGQYPDGFRGQFVIHDPENPYIGQFDDEVALTLSDWYHDEMNSLLAQFINYKNPTGAEPVPDAALMNDTQNLTVAVQPDKTYFFRISNIGAFSGQYFWIEDHTMRIIEVDGVYTEAAEASAIYLGAAQRYGVLVTTKSDASKNFAMVSSMDTSLFDTVPDSLNWNVTGWLMYDQTAPQPAPALVDDYGDYDDFNLVPHDGLARYENVDKSIPLLLEMNNLGDGASYAFFNEISYVTPVVPTLYSVMSSGEAAGNASIYGGYTNSYVLEQGDVVEIIINNHDSGKHPFHLHGHDFQVIARPIDESGDYDPNNSTYPAKPMRRDTLVIKPDSNFVIRFVADNPGVWFFHCHIDWHLVTGLAATMIEAPLAMQKNLTIPENHYDMCRAGSAPYAGNAAGNTKDLFDLTGQNADVGPLPAGFTARGIVALVFSCVSAFLGMAAIAWYGAAPLGSAEMASAQRFVAAAGDAAK